MEPRSDRTAAPGSRGGDPARALAGEAWALDWLATPTGRRIMILMATLFALRLITLYSAGSPLEADFAVFHTAAGVFLAGDTLRLFDNTVFDFIPEASSNTRWLYPAHALFLFWPLDLMPLRTAYVVQGLVTWSLFALAGIWLLRTLMPKAPAALHVMLVAGPACFWPLMMGHPTLLWYAGLVVAMVLLERRRAVAAGIVIGLLTFKPTLGLLVAVALIAAGQWRAVIAAGATAILLSALATLSVGVEYWPALFAKMLEHLDHVDFADDLFDRFGRRVGPHALVVFLGGSLAAASAAQAVTTLLCVAVIAVVWADPRLPATLRIATLFALIPMAAPTIWFYDITGMAVAAVLFVAAGAVPRTVAGVVVLALLYVNVLLPFLFDQSAGITCIPAAIGAAWLALRARGRITAQAAARLQPMTEAQ